MLEVSEARTRRWLAAAKTLGQWVVLGVVVGVLCGSASALFLFLLETVTHLRVEHEVIVFALPVAGWGIGWLYARFGASIQSGSGLVIDAVHDGGPPIPLRMAPMVLIGTVLTHLFGGSAGREGTAVQMGASMADALATRLKLSPELRRCVLAAGMAGGFGSVFGTPIAGTVFALESVVIGRLRYEALLPALVAALVGDMTTAAWGIGHTAYPSPPDVPLTPLLLGQWALFAVAVALTTTAFIELNHGIKRFYARYELSLPTRMMIGGGAVVLLWQLVGTGEYLGLGVPTIVRAFEDPHLGVEVFALKLVFTAVTLSAGYLGGEVTPLFFIGAALGSVLAQAMGIPLELGAGVGMATVFAASSNAPLALSLMAVELLGANILPHVVIVAALAYLLTGHRGIYPAQRLRRGKWGEPELKGTLKDVEGQ